MPAENNVVIRLNVKSDTGAIARTQAMLRTLGSDVNRSNGLFGKMSQKLDMTKRSLTAFEKSAMFAANAVGKTFKLATMNAGAQLVIFGAAISTVNGLFRIGQASVKLYQFAMAGLAGLFATAAVGAGLFAAALREQAAALSSFQYSSQKQFGPAINQARMALANLERDTQLATLGTKALTAAFQAASKHSEFTGASQATLRQMANFALASGNPEKAMAAAGDFVGLLEKRKATIGQIQKAMKATMGDDMYKKIQQANAKAKKEDKVNLGSAKSIREAVMSGRLAKLAGVEGMLGTMNETLIGQLKSYMGQAKALFADFGQPLMAPAKEAFQEIFHILRTSFQKISVSFQQFGANTSIPFIVKVVEKLSNAVVNLTQKYLPQATGWFEKFSKPFKYIKNFFKETLPNTLRPYKESAKVITDMFGKIFGPVIGGNVRRVSDLIKDNKVELLDFASATGKLLQNLNKLSGEIMKAFFRLLPVLTPVINSIASLVGMISKVFGALANLGGLGGGKGGTNFMGSVMSGLSLAMMFRGKSFIGNKESYTVGASNKSMFGRFWNRRMGLPGQQPGVSDQIYTNRSARQMAVQTGAVAYIPGQTGSMYPGGGGGRGGAGGGGYGIGPTGAQEPGQLSLYALSAGGAKSRFTGRTQFMNPALLKRSEMQGYSLQTQLNDEVNYATGGLGASGIASMRKSMGLKAGETKASLQAEHSMLSGLGGTMTVRQQRRLNDLNALLTPTGGGMSQIDNLTRLEEQKTLAENRVMRREQMAAQQAANPTGLTPFQQQMRSNIVGNVTATNERRGANYRAKQDSLRARGLNAQAQAASAAAAGDMDAAARLQRKSDLLLHKSAVAGTRADNLQDLYRTTAAGNLERRTDEVTGQQYYNPALASRSERRLNRQQGYESATAGGVMVEGKLDELTRKQQAAMAKSQDYALRSDVQLQQGQGMRARFNRMRANLYETQAKGGNIFSGFGAQKNELLGTEGITGAQRLGRLSGNAFRKFSLGKVTGALGPGGPGLLGAKDANGMYTSRRGRILGGQSQGANMATSIGMSFLASKGVGDQGSMALGASLAPMFGPMAALAVGFGGSALKAKTAKGGAAAGAIAGAAIGTMVPVIGTAVGAAIGAVVGFAAGTINRGRLERKAAKGVAKAMVAGFEQKASYDAFTKFTEAPGRGNKQMTRADYVARSFNQVIKMADAFGKAGGKATTDQVRGDMIDQLVKSGVLTEKEGKDAKKHSTAFTVELEKQAAAYKKIGKLLTESYNPKINRMAELTGKSAAEIEKMADSMGVNLLDPTLKSIDALKQLGFFISKTAQQLKTELSNAMIDSVSALDEFVKAKQAPLVMNEIAQGFGEKARAGGLETGDVTKFLQDVMTNAQTVNPNDPAAALQLFMDTVGMGPNGQLLANSRVFTDKTSPLYGAFESFSKAGGLEGGANTLINEVMNNPTTGLKSKTAFAVYDQLQAMAMEGGMVLPQSVLDTLNKQLSANQLAGAYSKMTQMKDLGQMSISQDLLTAANSTDAGEANKAKEEINKIIIGRVNTLLGPQSGALALTSSDITAATTAQEKTTQTQIDLMSESEQAILEGLTKQWGEIAKSMSTGSAPNWFKDTPTWWSNAPSWYGDTSSPKNLKPHDTPTSRVQQTLARHRAIDSTITGKRTVTSSLRNFNLGSLGSDHATGNAYDLVGQNLGAYSVAVKRSGGFAEFHGGQANRHLHVVPGTGDTAMPSVVGVRSASGGPISNSYNITINGTNQDPEAIANAVMEKIKRSQRSLNERS